MKNRIYLNDNEDTHYPLMQAGTGIPDNMLSGISILVDTSDTVPYISALSSSPYDFSIVFNTKDGRYAYCVWDHSGHPVTPIISYATKGIIGWVTIGSGSDVEFDIAGKFDINPGCITYQPPTSESDINGAKFYTPDVLNIEFTGELGFSTGVIYTGVTPQEQLDGRDRENFGSLTSVNHKAVESIADTKIALSDTEKVVYVPGIDEPQSWRAHCASEKCIHITLPSGDFRISGTVTNSIKDPYEPVEARLKTYTITISQYSDPDVMPKYGDVSPYECPFRDPIIDKITTAKSDESSSSATSITGYPEEMPADVIIKGYREFIQRQYKIDMTISYDDSSSSTPGEGSSSSPTDPVFDTIVVSDGENNTTYTPTDDTRTEFTESMETVQNAITVTYPDGAVEVFVQDSSNSGIYYTE